ncbi:hypothetical protein A8W25_09820 [Streptomyces sp. ERV7]|uniref:hypothetical protein n=1 Tax=Streptomyces sp. ERV7 TaxID=1322334 RepID=UPI0007F3FCE3|nr:hypothetical protein [Streptomyces sp. ERV7]OAR25822.1 hypothetical protein A8W25_09820 [Streptomyces sp. ERV7]
MEMRQWRSGWDKAADATEEVRQALNELGASEGATARLRPVVSGKGTPWVDVGMIPASLAQALAEAVRAGVLERSGRSPSHP